MSTPNKSSMLHKQAATDHEAAAKHHRKAADLHDKNNLADAKASSKSAMQCCTTAQQGSNSACASSDA